MLGGDVNGHSVYVTYHPRLVHEIVDWVQRIDARDAAVLQAEHDVLPVVGRISSVLPQQHEVRLDRSAGRRSRARRVRHAFIMYEDIIFHISNHCTVYTASAFHATPVIFIHRFFFASRNKQQQIDTMSYRYNSLSYHCLHFRLADYNFSMLKVRFLISHY